MRSESLAPAGSRGGSAVASRVAASLCPGLRSRAVPASSALILIATLGFVSLASGDEFPPVVLLREPGPASIVYHDSGEGRHPVGTALAALGDFDGDGLEDLALSSAEADDVGPGRVWIVRGGRRASPIVDLDRDSTELVELTSGGTRLDRFGVQLAPAGDIDRDGLDDLLVAAPGEIDPTLPVGAWFIIRGSRDDRDVVALRDSRRAIAVHAGANFVIAGLAASAVGDLDADGFGDLAFAVSENGRDSNAVFLLFGSEAIAGSGRVDLTAPAADQRILRIPAPAPSSRFGASVAPLGDFDGDGLLDAAIGAPGDGPGGRVYVLFGRAGPWPQLDLGEAPAGRFAVLESNAPAAHFGAAIAGTRDVTGDGLPDTIVGAPGFSIDGSVRGGAVLIRGGPELRGRGQRSVPEPAAGDHLLVGGRDGGAGTSVGLAPDTDGDGIGEVLVGAPEMSADAGVLYLVYGFTGAELSERTSLESLRPGRAARGAKFIHDAIGARLGAAVIGLGDRQGLGRGGFAVAAPGAQLRGRARGAVFEIVAPIERSGPRNLQCQVVPGSRVTLSWNLPRLFRSLAVVRNGVPIAEGLPGNLLRFVDPHPDPDRNEYVVEANGDPATRSEACIAQLRSIGVDRLDCRQEPRSRRASLRWRNVDRYDALRVEVDGAQIALLPGHVSSAIVDLTPGAREIAIVTLPGEARTVCEIDVVDEFPALGELVCEREAERDVRLHWTRFPPYLAYEVRREGRTIGVVADGSTFLDSDPPGGSLEYVVRGLVGSLEGPASTCRVDVPPPGGLVSAGRVIFDDAAETPITRGLVVLVAGGGRIVARAQLDVRGEFRVSVPDAAPYTAVYSLDLAGFAASDPARLELSDTRIVAELEDIVAGRPVAEATIRVPLPVVGWTSARAESRLWDALRARVGDRTAVFAGVSPPGAARGALALEAALEFVRADLIEQWGAAPRDLDLVAFGSGGVAARLFAHTGGSRGIRKLVLLGTPNLGTTRAVAEIGGEVDSRPPRGSAPRENERYGGAEDTTPRAMADFNDRVTSIGDVEIHLIAGIGGQDELDDVVDCDDHDSRVCRESALGGIPDAQRHTVAERHANLGRGERSIELLIGDIGIASVERIGVPLERAADLDGAAQAVSEYPTGNLYDGVLQPGDSSSLPLYSDTSGSVIIILNSPDLSGLIFALISPSGEEIDATNASTFGVDYVSFGDGEGQLVQAYRFAAAEVGTYTAVLANPSETDAVLYHLELHGESDVALEATLEPETVDPLSTAIVAVRVARLAEPLTGIDVEARVLRPDGSLDAISLTDAGIAPDTVADDGVYHAAIPPSEQSGVHFVEIVATDGDAATFWRTTTIELVVRSNVARLGTEWTSRLEDVGGVEDSDTLWIGGSIIATRPGVFFVDASLADSSGAELARSGDVLEVDEAGTWAVEIPFDVATLFERRINGPYEVSRVELIDATFAFVEADLAFDVHETAAYEWREFGIVDGQDYIRGDASADGRVDVSDPIRVLLYLFDGGVDSLDCLDAADANDDAAIDLSDAVSLLDYLFVNGQPLPPPFPGCGSDEGLGCVSFGACP
jgi:hypothetical protein